MSHPAAHTDDDDHLELKPRPRRPFELGSDPPTPTHDTPSSSFPSTDKLQDTPSRNRSFLNLTSSTLFGIYAPSGLGTGADTVSPTPFGDGTQTPAERRSFDFTRSNTLPANAFTKSANGKLTRRRDTNTHGKRPKPTGFRNFLLPLLARLTALFTVGTLYGLLISHLHDRQHLAPTNVAVDRQKWSYLIFWGIVGVILGEALPWADLLWAEEDSDSIEDDDDSKPRTRRRESWLDAVRSIGLFVGIAFAIRKLPWQSTLQLSLTLALANPAIWYLVDRSPPGFILSTIVALGGTVFTLGVNPDLLPSPTPGEVLRGHVAKGGGIVNGTLEAWRNEELVLGVFSQESVGVATWIASVFFVSAVCFGNVGRRLCGRRI